MEVSINLNQVIKVNETGHMIDHEGALTHPNRTLNSLHVFIFVEKGCIEVTENETCYQVHEGNFLFLKAGLHHFGTKPFLKETEWSYIHFFNEIPLKNRHLDSLDRRSLIPASTYDKSIVLPKRGIISPIEIKGLLEEITSPLTPYYIKSNLTQQLFYKLFKSTDSINEKPAVEKVLKLIESHDGDITHQQLANAVHLNQSYLSHLIKKETGMTIQQHKKTIKINRAIYLFQTTSKNITEVSLTLNFPNPYYFSRVFKEVTGINPRTFMNQRYAGIDASSANK